MNMDEKTIAVVITAGAVLCTALYNYYFSHPEIKEPSGDYCCSLCR